MINTYFHIQKQIKSVNDLYEIFSLDKNLYYSECVIWNVCSRKEYFSRIFNFSRLLKKEDFIYDYCWYKVKEFEGRNDVLKYNYNYEKIIETQLKEKYKHILENNFLYINEQVPSYAKLNKNNRL